MFWSINTNDSAYLLLSSDKYYGHLDKYSSFGQYNVVCEDSIYKIISITDEHWIYIPNSFTPNSDEINDLFYISYHGIREETFKINIYNRLNELVYSTRNISDLSKENGWDGTHQNTNKNLPSGTYIYELSYQDLDGWKKFKTNKINLIR